MSSESILDQIIVNQQAEEISRLDVIELISDLFNELNNRERDVLIRRFGLHGKNKETLEEIGQVHQLTRERIRQIETFSIKKLKQLENLNNYVSGLKKVIVQLLEEHGGLMEKEYMIDSLVGISTGFYKAQDKATNVHRSHFNFLISKILPDELEEMKNLKYFKNLFKLKFQSLEHLEPLIEELLEKIKEIKKTLTTEELINLTKKLSSYKNCEEKFKMFNNIDIVSILNNDLFSEKADLINTNKAIYSIFRVAQNIEQNKFGYWGIDNWREINPKTINDKIYLILKNQNKPMHFAEIANKINQINFDEKQANAATVHNELIVDDKYILVGRGLYGLKEWGYNKGTVIEVIQEILEQVNSALSRNEIIDRVLSKRMVKKTTINLALMNKDKFERLSDNKYQLKKTI
ncbi:MAG: sigma factor-like helix-turn-helix DNA-binding protein [Patescibacteria group bacterium]|nr:hypothetical protein [Patescibacteria group bacterium]MBU1870691.1 hypothetical protein [Patescibacteria group bacterium]